MPIRNNIRHRSISKQLTVMLIVAIGVISIAVIGGMHIYRVRIAKHELEAKANELYAYLDSILKKSLWDIDENNIRIIGDAISQNELVASLMIKDSFGDTIYKKRHEAPSNTIKRTGNIFYKGAHAGYAEVSLTQKFYHESTQQLLFASLITLVIALIVLIFTTGILIRWFLQGPLDSLNNILDAYSAGVYKPRNAQIPYREFQQFGRVLSEMGKKITRQLEEVRQAEEKYRNIFENAVEGIFQSTIDGRFLSVSPSMAKIHGYQTPEDLINSVTNIGAQCYANPEDRDEFTRQIIQRGVVKRFETKFVQRDNSLIWVSLSARLVNDDKDQPPYYEGFCLDINKQKNLENQLRQAQKMEAIGTLAGGIAHDFNNILGVILGCSELTLERVSKGSEEQILLEKVLGAARRAKDLVKQILTFSRQDKSEIKPLYLKPIVKETLKFIRATTPATIEVEQKIDEKVGAALVDPTQIHRLLMNLYTNAIYAMGTKGGVLKVGLAQCLPPENTISDDTNIHPGDWIELTVQDTGCGMSSETVERIFDPFFTTKPVGKGTGLGLSVVHGIVKKHNGTIMVDSQLDMGTTFKIYLPRIKQQHVKIMDELESNVPVGSENILVVDDERELLNTMQQILEELGYKISTTTNSLKAYDMFKASPEKFDMIITDFTMPDMTGIDLAKKINRNYPDLPILMCTGFSEFISPEQTLSAGIVDVLFKPVARWQLATTIRKVLDQCEKKADQDEAQ